MLKTCWPRQFYHLVAGFLTGTLLQHYKKGLYREIRTVLDSTNDRNGQLYCLYYSIKKDQYHLRLVTEMYEILVWNDGIKRPRFCGCSLRLKYLP